MTISYFLDVELVENTGRLWQHGRGFYDAHEKEKRNVQ